LNPPVELEASCAPLDDGAFLLLLLVVPRPLLVEEGGLYPPNGLVVEFEPCVEDAEPPLDGNFWKPLLLELPVLLELVVEPLEGGIYDPPLPDGGLNPPVLPVGGFVVPPAGGV
jgi:hypothetical protein